MKKRIFAAILATLVAVATTACGEPADSSQPEADSVSDIGGSAATTEAKDMAEATSVTTVSTTTTSQETKATPELTEPKVEEVKPETELEEVESIDLITLYWETPYTEFESIGMLLQLLKLIL